MYAAISRKKIETMAGVPLTEEESKQVMLGTLESFDKFCNAHNLKYWLSYGTLIGAIRHQGFIPWDDDADIVMPRDDYNKLIEFERISDYIEIVSVKNPHGYYHPFAYSKLSDNRTISIIKDSDRNTGRGQFIDVFPLDNVPDDKKCKEKFFKRINALHKIRSLAVRKYKNLSSVSSVYSNVITFLFRPMSALWFMRLIDRTIQKYDHTDTQKWGILSFTTKSTCIHFKADFINSTWTDFEGIELSIPEGYDRILRDSYGDYMELPPEDKRIPKHDTTIYWKK